MSTMAAAADTVRVSGGAVQVSPSEFLKNMTLSVTGPNGFSQQEFSRSSAPRVSLYHDGWLMDGTYTWSLTGSTSKALPPLVSQPNNGRGDVEPPQRFETKTSSGSFVISGGTLVQPDPSTGRPLTHPIIQKGVVSGASNDDTNQDKKMVDRWAALPGLDRSLFQRDGAAIVQ